MKKSNQSGKKNRKMTTTTTVAKISKKPKQSVASAVSEWVIDTLSSSLPQDQVKTLRETLESKQSDLQNILSANIKDTSSRKRLKDPNAPKRGKSSYIFFCVDNREKIKKNNPEMSAKDIIKELGRVWRDTSDEKKQKYIKLSEDDKERYSGEISEYVPPENFANDKKKKDKRVGPKRSLTSYIFFCKEKRAFLKEKQPNLSTKDITSELGKKWKALSDEQKTPYTKLADEDKARYESEKISWVDTEKPSDEKAPTKSEKEKTHKKSEKSKSHKDKPNKKSKSHKDKPKNKGGYSLFCQEERESLKEEHPKWSSQQLTKELGKYWEDLSQEEQDEYNERAEHDIVEVDEQ